MAQSKRPAKDQYCIASDAAYQDSCKMAKKLASATGEDIVLGGMAKKGSKKLATATGKSGKTESQTLLYFMLPVVLAFGVFAFGGFGADGEDFALDGGAGGRELKSSSIPWKGVEVRGGVDGVCEMGKWLQSEFPVQGQHILCLARRADGALEVQVAKHMMAGALLGNFTIAPAVPAKHATLASIRAELEAGVGFEVQSNEWDPKRKQPWALFTTGGARVNSMAQALRARTLMLVEGGQWVWPGVVVGHRQEVRGVGESNEPVVLETLSLRPLIFTVSDFISKADAAHIRAISAPHLKVDSTVSQLDHDIGKADNTWRTSQTHWLSSRADAKGVVSTFNRKVARLTRLPSSHQEHIQMLHYDPGAGYDMHIDAFDPSMYTKSPDIMRMIDGGHTNRYANIFAYLSDVEEGGETIFPRSGKLAGRQPHDLSHGHGCETDAGIKSKPVLGKVLLFYILHPNGNIDQDALHGSCSVKKGIKWSANKWVWNRPQGHVGSQG